MIQLSLSFFWWVTRNSTIHDRKVSKHYPAKRLADGVEQHAPDKYIHSGLGTISFSLYGRLKDGSRNLFV